MKSITALATLILVATQSSTLRAEEASALAAMLPPVLHDASGEKIDPATLKGKHVGLYFSAHWCPPCRAFTPSLVKFRDQNVDENFEIVFVSLDQSEGEKKTYIREMGMKWLSIPGVNSKHKRSLEKRFQIEGIPALVVLAPDGSLVTANGCEDVMYSPDTALRKWKEKDPS